MAGPRTPTSSKFPGLADRWPVAAAYGSASGRVAGGAGMACSEGQLPRKLKIEGVFSPQRFIMKNFKYVQSLRDSTVST